MIQFIKDLIAANVLVQGLLIFLFFKNREFFDSLYTINQTTNSYFWFLVIGSLATLWMIWTSFTYLFGIRRLGYKAETATRKARK